MNLFLYIFLIWIIATKQRKTGINFQAIDKNKFPKERVCVFLLSLKKKKTQTLVYLYSIPFFIQKFLFSTRVSVQPKDFSYSKFHVWKKTKTLTLQLWFKKLFFYLEKKLHKMRLLGLNIFLCSAFFLLLSGRTSEANTIIVRSSASLTPFRSSFNKCCAAGKEANVCADYSRLLDRSSSCKFAFTICCTQNKRKNECERGKKAAYAGQTCADLKKEANCDTPTVNSTFFIA